MNIDELYNLDYLSEDVGINPLCKLFCKLSSKMSQSRVFPYSDSIISIVEDKR